MFLSEDFLLNPWFASHSVRFSYFSSYLTSFQRSHASGSSVCSDSGSGAGSDSGSGSGSGSDAGSGAGSVSGPGSGSGSDAGSGAGFESDIYFRGPLNTRSHI